jgi:hypothetical protein
VLALAYEAPEGVRRLEALFEAYFSYLERWVFRAVAFRRPVS